MPSENLVPSIDDRFCQIDNFKTSHNLADQYIPRNSETLG